MTCRRFHCSMARISDLDSRDYELGPVDRDAWKTGDYVVCEVVSWSAGHHVELPSGRLIELLAGAGRYRDILSMADAGAGAIYDFVDAGLPSTVHPPEDYRRRLRGLLPRMAGEQADVAVVEVGASPLEPYNGDVAVEELGEAVRCRVLCASDPYAVIGVMSAWEFRPDLVTGITANTRAGVDLVEGLPVHRFSPADPR